MKIIAVLLTLTFMAQAHAFTLNSLMKKLNKSMAQSETKPKEYAGSYLEIQNPPEGNHETRDFAEAKKIFKQTHYMGQQKTLYCGCDMTAWNKFSGDGCSYKHVKFEKQWQSIEAEHLVPFSQILSGTKAYREGLPEICGTAKGRKCADKVYGFLAGDLWILGPAEMELNRVHSNYQWAELGNQGEQFGTCDFYYQDKKVQPPKILKGKIARAYKYIQSVYKVKVISDKNQKLFDIWASYAPTQDQCNVAKKIVEIQKNRNEFEIEACKKANLW